MNTINKIAARLILGVAVVATTATASLSAPITVPAGLNPGDQYRLAFVTSTTRDAHTGNIADYNAFVTAAANTQANLTALGTTWMAIASTTTIDARDNTGTNPSSTGFPIYLLDAASTKLADNNADLWDGSIDAALKINEAGVEVLDTLVWTGTTHSGTASSNLELGDGRPAVGFSGANSGNWIALTAEFQHNLLPLYAVSGVLTVAQVAEPGALGVLALGLVGFAVMRRKRMS